MRTANNLLNLPAVIAVLLIPCSTCIASDALAIPPLATASNSSAEENRERTLERKARSITVRIEGASQGSGVLVKHDGNTYTVLTAWHVVKDQRTGEELSVITSDDKEHKANTASIFRLGDIDMAILTFDSPSKYELAILGNVEETSYNDRLLVAGFPISGRGKLHIREGKVVANAEVGIDQGYQLLYDNPTLPGMSGGPLLSSQGQLVGIHGRGERNEHSTLGLQHGFKTGVNQGVPNRFYKMHLEGKPVRVLNKSNKSPSDYLVTAWSSIGIKGREQSVIRLAKQSLSLQENSHAHVLISISQASMGKLDQAEASYLRYINEDDPFSKHLALSAIAELALTMEMWDKAIDRATQAILLSKTVPLPYLTRGYAFLQKGEYTDSIRDFSSAIAFIEERGDGVEYLQDAYIRRADAHRVWGNDQKACIDYKAAVSLGTGPGTTRAIVSEMKNWLFSEAGAWCLKK